MKHAKTLGSYALLLSFIATAPAAYAQTGASIRVDAGLNASTSANGTSVLERSTTSSSRGNATPNASAEGTANANVNSRINATATSESSFNTLNGSTSAKSKAKVFSMSRKDLKSNSDDEAMNPALVTTPEGFSAYAKTVLSRDENVMKVEAADGHVSIWYKEPAKFLGIVPVMVTTKATVNASGTVQIEHPWWYKVFVRDDGVEELQTNLNATVGTIARAEASTELSTSLQARLLNALRAGMKAHYDLTVSATTSTDMSDN